MHTVELIGVSDDHAAGVLVAVLINESPASGCQPTWIGRVCRVKHGEPLAWVPALVHCTQDGQLANPGLASEGHPLTGAIGVLHFVAGPTPQSAGSDETR